MSICLTKSHILNESLLTNSNRGLVIPTWCVVAFKRLGKQGGEIIMDHDVSAHHVDHSQLNICNNSK